MEENLIKMRKQIEDHLFTLECEGTLVNQGKWILDVIEEEYYKVDILEENFKMQIGFITLKFKKEDNEVKIITPDLTKNPFNDYTYNISLFLILQLQQNDIIKKLQRITAENIAFDDKIKVYKDCKNKDNFFLIRDSYNTKNYSGWLIDFLNDDGTRNYHSDEEFEDMYVYEVLKFRPDLVKLLSLPKGYRVAIINNEIKQIVTGDNQFAYLKSN